jgi:hypothetical protein
MGIKRLKNDGVKLWENFIEVSRSDDLCDFAMLLFTAMFGMILLTVLVIGLLASIFSIPTTAMILCPIVGIISCFFIIVIRYTDPSNKGEDDEE